MQHDLGCDCSKCSTTSTADTLLVGLSIITGVVIAITTGSKWVVGAAILVLIGLAVRKLRSQDRSPRKGLHGQTKVLRR